ncbi:Tetrapyrrole-binding protein, chloroplastic [Sesamum angolense]|uniref:Tetrapyrrole-binding protein, chloroplastic n=1 Tax=Sesamum angolense TaxID=2727404 RepID=A0AAE1T9U6_9LAMI|nr:Tetrapyrrole-binding protein, chloroplastic [Sesamum angolense]
MATNTFNSVYHTNHSLRRRHSIDCTPTSTTTTNYSFFLKPTTPAAAAAPFLSHSAASAVSSTTFSTSTTTNPSTSQNVSFEVLRQHLSSKNFREADEETRRLLIVLAGEAAQKRAYVFFSEVKFISEDDLKTIDGLWREHSDNKFGYSVQKRIWNKVNKDFTKFFIKVGWMKKLESSEVEQYNYRSFPTEFMWEMEEGTPEGHLPLTNALRGTQLLNSILNHPAFEGDDEDEDKGNDGVPGAEERDSGIKPLTKRIFKTTYTF